MRRGVGGAVGGYFAASFVAMCIVLAILFKRHQENLAKWRAAKASGGGSAATQEGVCVRVRVHVRMWDRVRVRVCVCW